MFESGRGGTRPGAGRKAKKGPTKLRSVRLKVANADWLENKSDEIGISQGDIVDLAIEVLQKHPKELPTKEI